jgi:hypothetical protein
VVWGVGMAILVGGWIVVVETDVHPLPVILPTGFILAAAGALMRQRKPKASSNLPKPTIPTEP